MSDAGNKPPARRRFFRQALNGLLKSVDEALKQRGLDEPLMGRKAQTESRKPDSWRSTIQRAPPLSSHSPATRLRPPGALAEPEFLQRCHRGGECVAACPVHAIQVTRSDDPAEDGTPFITPREGACVVCDELACIAACPSGALAALADRSEIRMGAAKIEETTCLRTSGEPCRECLDRCPFGDLALGLGADGRLEVRSGCVGCGVCEFFCPTAPRSIFVVPLTRDGPSRG